MTSFAFILGVVPLVFATGAGAAGQQALGTAVFGGMLASTFLAVVFVPAFFVVFQSFGEWWGHGRPQTSEQSSSENATGENRLLGSDQPASPPPVDDGERDRG
jgi:HAE1 family hydrophobic/amphiphilic exporter-1